MTIRSTPPASSHLAESPVPAPPPTIGSPRATIARNFSIRAERWKPGIFTSPRVARRQGHSIDKLLQAQAYAPNLRSRNALIADQLEVRDCGSKTFGFAPGRGSGVSGGIKITVFGARRGSALIDG